MRERWFGATVGRCPRSCSRGRSTSKARSSSTTSPISRRVHAAHVEGTPVVVRASTPEEVVEALSHGEVACVLVRDPKLARGRPGGDDVWLGRASSRRTRSALSTSRRASGASPCSRSSSASARVVPLRPAARRRDRDPVVREPEVRAGRARAAPRGPVGRGDGRAADGRRRGTGAAPARDRRRAGPVRVVHGRGLPRLGRPPARRRVRGAGEHPRLRRDSRRARRDVRGDRGQASRLAAARLPRRGAGGRRRPPRAAVGLAPRRRARPGLRGALRHRRRPAGGGPRAAPHRAPAHLQAPRRALRRDAALGMDRGRRRAPAGDRGPARGRGLTSASRTGRARRTSRTGSTARTRSTRSCSRSCGGSPPSRADA